MITFLSGGTGTPKLIDGFRKITNDSNISVITNTADNFWVYGLYVAPDVDTVMYLFANLLDKEKYWGIDGDTFQTMNALKKIWPDAWFNLGDKDLVTHLIRTDMLRKGMSLSMITKKLCKLFDVSAEIIPATDNHIETRIISKEGKDLHFQEYWVKHRGELKIKKIYFTHIERAQVPKKAIKALQRSELIIIGPSNPITSIGPIINLPEISQYLKRNRDKCVAVSPIIGDKAVSGPAAKLMEANNIESSAFGVAEIYSDITSTIFIDKADEKIKNKIEQRFKLRVFTEDIFFKSVKSAQRLAQRIIEMMNNA